MHESSIYIAEYDQTLTILSCIEQDEVDAIVPRSRVGRDESPEDEDVLLKPLDGHLPWPGKSRR